MLHRCPCAGYFPIRLQSLPEGSCLHAHCPVFQITTEGPYAPLCTFLEVLLTFVWCVAASIRNAYAHAHGLDAPPSPPSHHAMNCSERTA